MGTFGRQLLISLLTALALPIEQTSARDWPSAGGWDVTESSDYCSIHMEFEGKGATELSLLLESDDSVILGMSNSGWSIKKGAQEDLSFSVNGTIYGGGTSVGITGDYEYKKGFATKFGREFLADFAASSYLIVRKNDVVVDNLSLKGSASALTVAKRCIAAVRRDIATAAAEKRRFSEIADDPFAAPGTAGGQSIAGGPRGNPSNWFTDDDYPADAKRANAQGSVSVLLNIDASGKVVNCKVTASSGNALLDQATCSLAQRRGRFTIQKDAQGNAQPYTWSMSPIWSLRSQ